MTAEPGLDPVEQVGLRAPDVQEQTGATYRQLDYWTRQGHVQHADVEPANTAFKTRKPVQDMASPGSGWAKLWPPAEVEAIRRAVIVSRAFPHLTGEAVFRIARADSPLDLGDGIVVTTPWSTT